MTRNPLIWLAGLAISVVAHLAAGTILLWSLDPDVMPEQVMPEARMQLSAYPVERSEGIPSEPDSQTAPTEEATGDRLGPGAIPRSRAKAIAPSVTPARIAAAESLALSATAVAGQLLASAQAESKPVAATLAPTFQLTSQPPVRDETITAIAAPTELLANRPPKAQAVALAAPPSIPLTNAEVAPVALPQSEPEVTRAKAALAFSGAGDGPVDPVSLTAFQSFMAPEAAGDSAAELRDGVAGILAQIPCARMQVQFEPATNTLNVVGHVPEEGMRAPVLQALQAQMGADIAVADNLLILPRPQCGALVGIAGVGLPQSTDQITNPLLVGEDTHAREFRYAEGQQLILDLTAPDYDAYLYVDYFDAQGQVIHLSPNDSTPLALALAKTAQRIGAEQQGDPGLYITIGPPYGQEIAVAFAASQPLYEAMRPLVEPAAPYLEWMKARVSVARAADPDFKGEWVYFFVTTAAQ